MKCIAKRIFLAALAVFWMVSPCVVHADKGPKPDKDPNAPPPDAKQVWVNFVQSVNGMFNWALALEILVALVLASVLALLIAHHPRSYGKAATLEEAEQPKIFIMYSIVGAVVALIVKANPNMAFVIFGIGGLFRFRTDVGPAKDTGRVILVTCIGLCCGLGIYLVAVMAMAFGWIVIYILEGRTAYRVAIKGIEATMLGQAAEAYHTVLVENGLIVMSQKKNFVKGQVAFVFRAPGKVDRDALEELFKDIPPKLHGSPDWESS